MRIGVAFWGLQNIGGIQRFGCALANEMASRGHQVTLFHEIPSTEKIEPFYPLHSSVGLCSLRNDKIMNIAFAREKLIMHSLDVLVPIISSNALLWFPHIVHKSGIPLLISEHNNPDIINRERWNWHEHNACLAAADRIHVLLDSYKNKYPEFLHDRIEAIPNPAKIIPGEAIRQESAPKVILGAGRFEEAHKQFSLMIKAFALLRKDFPDWNMVLCGDGPDQRVYKTLIKKLRLAARVKLPGQVSDMDAWYAGSRIFCIPSRFEGFPLTALEAQGHGLPVVGFAGCSGVNEIVVHEENGLLVEAMTPESLAEALAMLMNAPELGRRMGCRGLELLARFDQKTVYDQWEALLHKTAAHKGQTRLQRFCFSEHEERLAIDALSEILSRGSPFRRMCSFEIRKLEREIDVLKRRPLRRLLGKFLQRILAVFKQL